MKMREKRGNNTLNIVFPRNRFFYKRLEKNDFWQFLAFLALKKSLWAIGTEKQPAEKPNGHLLENRRYPELPQNMGEV